MILENAISVCSIADIDTWKVASPRIIRRIRSSNYTVITPKNDLQAFAECSPSEFNVVPEEEYVDSRFRKLLQERVAESSIGLGRYGWYLQQFLKLSALRRTSKEGTSLIWDADTAPLRQLSFEKDGKILFYKGDEHHKPYFNVIDILLGLKKISPFSFIAQCLPYRGSWSKELFDFIENKAQKSWEMAILDSINFDETSGFSEYETLGTFAASQYPGEFTAINNSWQRFGNGLIGSANNLWLFESVLKAKYDFISFEKWNEAYSFYPGRKFRRRLKRMHQRQDILKPS